MTTFRAFWPITDQSIGWDQLLRQATEDLPMLAAQARVKVTQRGAFRIARSVDVPGSGRITETCLVYEAAAEPAPVRDYRRSARVERVA